MRQPTEPTKYTINFDESDRKYLLVQLFKQLIIEKELPDIMTRAEKLADEYIQQHN